MKLKFKTLATAATLALASLSSFAAIDFSANPDLIFVAWDGTGLNKTATYVRDLGSVSQLGSSNLTFSAPTNSIFTTQFTGVASSDIQWNIFALDNVNGREWLTGSLANQLAQNLSQFDAVATISNLVSFNFSVLQNPSNGYIKANNEFSGGANDNPADGTNGFLINLPAQQGLYDSVKGVGKSANLLFIDGATDPATESQLFVNAQLSNAAFAPGNVNGGYFTLANANGDITWTNQALSPVPVPGAALLFGPGLLAVFAAARRRRQA